MTVGETAQLILELHADWHQNVDMKSQIQKDSKLGDTAKKSLGQILTPDQEQMDDQHQKDSDEIAEAFAKALNEGVLKNHPTS